MKHLNAFVLFLCLLLSNCLAGQSTPFPGLEFDKIDVNAEGRNITRIHSQHTTELGELFILWDLNSPGRGPVRFYTFQDGAFQERAVLNLDPDDFELIGIHGNYVVYDDRFGNSVTVETLDLRDGTIKTIVNPNEVTYPLDGDHFLYPGSNGGTYISQDGDDGFRFTGRQISLHTFPFGDRSIITSFREMWVTDYTEEGTVQLDVFGTDPIAGRTIGDRFVYSLENGNLMSTDGTRDGAIQLLPFTDNEATYFVAASDEKIFFKYTSSAHGTELWETDGTPAGTMRLTDYGPGPQDGIIVNAPFPSSTHPGTVPTETVIRGGGGTNRNVYLVNANGITELFTHEPRNLTSFWRPKLIGQSADGTYFVKVEENGQAARIIAVNNGVTTELFAPDDLQFLGGEVIVGNHLFASMRSNNLGRLGLMSVNSPTAVVLDTLNGTRLFAGEDHVYYNGFSDLDPTFFRTTLSFRSASVTGEVKTFPIVALEEYTNNFTPFFFSQEGNNYAIADEAFSKEAIFSLEGGDYEVEIDLFDITESSLTDAHYATDNYLYYVEYSNNGAGPGQFYALSQPDATPVPVAPQGTEFEGFGPFVLGDYLLDQLPDGDGLYTFLGPQISDYKKIAPPITGLRILGNAVVLDGYAYFRMRRSFGDIIYLCRVKLEGPATAEIVQIFTPGPDVGSNRSLGEMVVHNGLIYLPAVADDTGWELWRTDGTPDGAEFFRDLNPGPNSADIGNVRLAGDWLILEMGPLREPAEIYVEHLGDGRVYRYPFDGNFLREVALVGDYLFVGAWMRGLLKIDTRNGELSTESEEDIRELATLSDGRVVYPSRVGVAITDGVTTETADVAFGEALGHYLIGRGDRVNSSENQIDVFNTLTGDLISMPDAFLSNNNEQWLSVGNQVYFDGISRQFGNEIYYFSLGGDLDSIQGTVFLDLNENGTQDADEPSANGVLVYAETNGRRTSVRTDAQGEFLMVVEDAASAEVYLGRNDCYGNQSEQRFPGNSENIIFSVSGQATNSSVNAHLVTGAVRCGFTVPVWATVTNTGCVAASFDVTLSVDEDASVESFTVQPDVSEENVLTWQSVTLEAGQSWTNLGQIRQPNEDRVGTPVEYNLSAISNDDDEVEDEFDYAPNLRCAIDPNDKLVSPSRAEPSMSNYTQFDETLTYTIRFQNTGNDFATTVRLEDELGPQFDLTTFSPVAASHKYRYALGDNGQLTVTFDEINLPDSTRSPVESNGFFSFDVRLLDDFVMGDVENTAAIYFDFNRPIITNTVQSSIVEFLDEDEDGFNFYDECNDQDASINPAAIDEAGNGIDENCDGQDGTVSTGEALSAQVQLYPNPTTDWVRLEDPLGRQLTVIVMDQTGRELLRREVRAGEALNLTSAAAGVYLVQLRDPMSGRTGYRKLVLRR
ncbi:T9SS type A sorting domain-containing protein [Lewinella sp. 4G2]|uniref:DUF7619 domain-containing protein n=1 Tax=Lewinella sp. 4G2 TaxID=1803372 RepID=UPI0007B4F5F3|nr:T9SS type A sorting domain-containing protein [Lewinella sp. 4G2]OAV44248.1 hypothetical protein A3850_006955 [Lewinella sp. 4G2]